MIIDGAENCVYDVFAAPDDNFALIFPEGTDVAFIEILSAVRTLTVYCKSEYTLVEPGRRVEIDRIGR